MGIDLGHGFLFRVTDRSGNITPNPFVGSAVANRLKKHLSNLKILNGETMHSFRSGCSITLKLLDVPCEEVAKHVGWKNLEMAIRYSQFDRVMNPNDASAIMSSSALQESSSIPSVAEKLRIEFRGKNSIKGCKPLFD